MLKGLGMLLRGCREERPSSRVVITAFLINKLCVFVSRCVDGELSWSFLWRELGLGFL